MGRKLMSIDRFGLIKGMNNSIQISMNNPKGKPRFQSEMTFFVFIFHDSFYPIFGII